MGNVWSKLHSIIEQQIENRHAAYTEKQGTIFLN